MFQILRKCGSAANTLVPLASTGCDISRARFLSAAPEQIIALCDKIHLKGMTFHGYHGALPEENVLGQKFIVNATLYCDLKEAGRTDRLDDTVSYAEVFMQIKSIMEGPPSQLLEHVAQTTADEIMQGHTSVRGVTLEIQKPHVAIPGVVSSLGIEITRFK